MKWTPRATPILSPCCAPTFCKCLAKTFAICKFTPWARRNCYSQKVYSPVLVTYWATYLNTQWLHPEYLLLADHDVKSIRKTIPIQSTEKYIWCKWSHSHKYFYATYFIPHPKLYKLKAKNDSYLIEFFCCTAHPIRIITVVWEEGDEVRELGRTHLKQLMHARSREMIICSVPQTLKNRVSTQSRGAMMKCVYNPVHRNKES